MPIAFIILIILGIIVLWFLLSFLFKPLGKIIGRIFKDAKDIIEETDDKNNDNIIDKKEN